MSKRIFVTGYIEVSDHEADPEHETGMTEAAFSEWTEALSGYLDDLEFDGQHESEDGE